MTFRDYVQGAFRMRGIGKGQTIHLYIIPEVQNLIALNIAACGPRFFRRSTAAAPIDTNALNWSASGDMLVAVSGWLLLNSMRQEKIQFGMLIEQNMNNVWRKQCFDGLKNGYTQFGLAPPSHAAPTVVKALASAAKSTANLLVGGTKAHLTMKGSAYLETCLDMFRSRIDFDVETAVPAPISFTQKLDDSVAANSLFLLTDPSAQRVIGYIRSLLVSAESNAAQARGQTISGATADKGGDAQSSDKERAFNSEQVQEQEQGQMSGQM
jgi:hypothetical protein